VRDPRRGMPYGGDGIYASARDIGNIAAGYVAGVNGIPWVLARSAFDGLQTRQDGKSLFGPWSKEGKTSQNAQKYGWRHGYIESASFYLMIMYLYIHQH
jgi:hypothetical protein